MVTWTLNNVTHARTQLQWFGYLIFVFGCTVAMLLVQLLLHMVLSMFVVHVCCVQFVCQVVLPLCVQCVLQLCFMFGFANYVFILVSNACDLLCVCSFESLNYVMACAKLDYRFQPGSIVIEQMKSMSNVIHLHSGLRCSHNHLTKSAQHSSSSVQTQASPSVCPCG